MAIISYGAVAIHLSLSFILSFFTSFTFWSEQAFYLNYKKNKNENLFDLVSEKF